ncbi:unnamed protein product [Polarella glacialis]|uniref:Uncharacterized protein n=1 Tax=Polarella glacialis TaxID=89957 RepID=A0A813LRX7_POLGL|nr:unnamed protein product [Polarella glacialis]
MSMLTPPHTPRAARPSSERFSSPVPTRVASTPPPRCLPGFNLEMALQCNCAERVRRALRRDPKAVCEWVSDEFGVELPIVKAARAGRSAAVVQALLEAGAEADEPPGSAAITPLAALAVGIPVTVATAGPVEELLGERQAAAMDDKFKFPLCPERPDDEEARMAVARLLLRAGADSERRNSKGQSAADLAQAAGRQRLARLLRRADGVRCRRVLTAMWAKRADQDSNYLLDLEGVPQVTVSDFLGEPNSAAR